MSFSLTTKSRTWGRQLMPSAKQSFLGILVTVCSPSLTLVTLPTQCAAVRIYRSLIRVPPQIQHNLVLDRPQIASSSLPSRAVKGNSPNGVSVPPTMWCTLSRGFPHLPIGGSLELPCLGGQQTPFSFLLHTLS